MTTDLIEQSYPIDFRKEEAKSLGNLIKSRRSVVLTGMKRVGISNFLRFFLFHKEINNKYLDDKKYFIIPVDLNDLVEREIFPFWILTFKRLADAVEKSDMPDNLKNQIDFYFSDSIQSQDLFLTIDYLRKSLVYLQISKALLKQRTENFPMFLQAQERWTILIRIFLQSNQCLPYRTTFL